MNHFLFTSESVSEGHPDKIADRISDSVLDACLLLDPDARVACETLVSRELVVLAGEISTHATIDYSTIVRQTLQAIGYDRHDSGFDYRTCKIIQAFDRQSPDIASGIDENRNPFGQQGAGDQGIMFGYACDETPELMPLPVMLAHAIVRTLRIKRKTGALSFLRPDAKAQVTVEYDVDRRPRRLHTVVISTQHTEETPYESIVEEMKKLVFEAVPRHLIDARTLFYINPAGRFVIGGPAADCGLTGRKIIADTYGGASKHGGGAFSGKDPSKVDRSAAYMARYIAKNIVAAKIATRCEIQLAYAIGIPRPVAIEIDTFNTGTVSDDLLNRIVPEIFELTPGGIIRMLDLKRPIYTQTSFEGHFGRTEPDFTWEKTNRVEAILQAIEQNPSG